MSYNDSPKYFITGGHGLLGKAVVKSLAQKNIPTTAPTRSELDLSDEKAVGDFISAEQPTHLIHLASKVYGLQGNLRNQFLSLSYNTRINDILFNAVLNSSIKKIFFSGTVASYPFPYISLPLKEEDLCKSLPHKGEYGYATSKLHALHYLKLLKEHHNIDFAYGLLTNLFGPNDKFDVENGHVIPSLICKAYNASIAKTSFEVWGREDTIRDFLFVEDAAEAILHLCQHGSGIYNIASGQETTMGELARLICNAANISEPIQWRPDLPVGIPKRTIDISRLLETGFINKNDLPRNIKITYDWYCNNINMARHD